MTHVVTHAWEAAVECVSRRQRVPLGDVVGISTPDKSSSRKKLDMPANMCGASVCVVLAGRPRLLSTPECCSQGHVELCGCGC